MPLKPMNLLFRRFVREDRAEDMIEYAFIAVFIGIAGALVLLALPGDIANTYSSWTDPTTGVPSIWDPCDPGVSCH